MIELDFKEPETFKTPDGEEYIINPLDTGDMKILLQFLDLNDQQDKLKSEGKLKELNKLVYVDLVNKANELVDKSIVNKNNGELLPEKYRKPYIHLVKLCNIIVRETIGRKDGEGGDNPLELPQKSSNKSGETSTPSKQKGGRKKN